MRLDISEILREVGKQAPYDLDEPPLVDEDVECVAPIRGRITFTNTGGTLLVRGKAETRIALPCSRCIEYFTLPIPLQIDEQFVLHHVSAGPRTLQTVTIVEEDESPIAGKLFDGHVFDLTELLRQYILLAQPTQPLPPTDANGLCAQCHCSAQGTLRIESHEAEEPINPAFSKLSQRLHPPKS